MGARATSLCDTFHIVGRIGYSIDTLSDGSVLVTGGFKGNATFGKDTPNEISLKSTGSGGSFVAKYRSNGSLEWVKGSSGVGTGVTGCTDESVLIAGYFSEIGSFGEGDPSEVELISSGQHDMYIAKYNHDGSLSWATHAGSNSDFSTLGKDIASFSNCSAVVTGTFRESSVFGRGEPKETLLNSVGGEDIFIAKYNSDGTLSWANSIGGTNVDSSTGIASLSDGSFFITGVYDGIFIGKYDANGALLWDRRGYGGIESAATDVMAMQDGSAFLVGYFTNTVTFEGGNGDQVTLVSQGLGDTDIFIIKYDSDGAYIWATNGGGPYNSDVIGDQGKGITTFNDGSALITGYFYGEATFGKGESNETTLNGSGGNLDEAFFLAKYNPEGKLEWAKASVGADVGMSNAAAPDGASLVVGTFIGTATFGKDEPNETLLTSEGDMDIFVAKFSP